MKGRMRMKFNMKKNNGITMVALVITIVVLLILSSIPINAGKRVIKQSELENLKTNMMLIKVKGKENLENANFNLGTTFDKITDETEKNSRIDKAKQNLKGTEISNASELSKIMDMTDSKLQEEKSSLIFYYSLSTNDLQDMGMSNVKSDAKNGRYIIKYDIKNVQIDVYNESGFENEGNTYYSLSEIENLEI